jgi:hypothetical protein
MHNKCMLARGYHCDRHLVLMGLYYLYMEIQKNVYCVRAPVDQQETIEVLRLSKLSSRNSHLQVHCWTKWFQNGSSDSWFSSP